MKSTLHLKFILLYIILGFLSIFTVASLSSTLTTHYLESSISGNMYQSANLLASNYLPDYFSKTIALADVYTQLNGMSDYLNSDIWFVDNEGSLLASAKSGDVSYAPSRIENFDPAESGGSTYLTGDYHGYFNSEMITVIAPVTENFSTHGYLLVHKPYSQITDAHSVLMRNTYIVILIIYVLSFIILLGVHFLIYRPLVKITNAAKQYASGNLDVVIPVNTQDEIGYLSASLNYMSSQLKDMEDYQKKFVANVSHDFRSPLTSIKGYVEAMADGTIPPEMQGKYLNIILFETERLTDLTRDLLTLNEFDTKDLLLDKTDFDIHEVIRNTAASFEGTCTAKKFLSNFFWQLVPCMYMLTGTKSNRFYTICWTTRSNSAIRSLQSRLKPHRAVTKYILPSKIMESAFRNQVSTKYGNVFTKAISPAEKTKKEPDLGFRS